MESHGYRLAIADRAFSFDGAYRVPTSLSVADRAAYGLRGSPTRDADSGFAMALRAVICGKLQCGDNRYTRRARSIKCGSDLYGQPAERIKCEADLGDRPGERKGLPNIRPGKQIKCGADLYGRPADSKSPPYISSILHTTVRAAIGDVALRVVALRGRVFVGVHSKCSTLK